MSLTFTAPLRANKPKRNVQFIGAGSASSMALDKKGRIWGWGSATSGQLGDNSIISKLTPVSVLGAVKTFCQISKGITFASAIDKNGLVWGWGYGTYGQLGNNLVAARSTPVAVVGVLKTFCKIAVGQNDVRAIDKYGRLWAWGINTAGQLGDNTTVSKRTPISVLGAVKTFCKIAATALGGGGNGSSYAIDKNGKGWSWGHGGTGKLGNNSTLNRLTPFAIYGNKTFCEISAGNEHALAIDKNGRAWAWGRNQNGGSLGDGSAVFSRLTPVSVVGAVKTFCKISAGGSSSLAIDKNGRLWGWGYNSSGQLGDGTLTNRNTPVSVSGAVKTFCEISMGANHATAVDKNGRAWAWGSRTSGQLGNNSITSRLTPVSVLGAVKTFCRIITGTNHSLGIDKNGRAWGWGSNATSQLGDNSTVSKLTPVSVLGGVKTFCQISAGQFHSLAIDKNGRAWGWGYNGSSQLGDNSVTQRLTPVSVLGAVKTFCQISAGGGNHSLAIDKNGRAWGWGFNSAGQLGDNSIVSKRTPVSVLGGVKTFCQISAGTAHSLAIDKNGRAWGWGLNTSAQLGDNSTVSKLTPVSVLGGVKTFCQISAGGGNHSLAIDKNGRAWGWGLNTSAQLGDNSTVSKLTPVSVLGGVKTFCQISAGNAHSLAIDKNGRAWAWGSNTNAQLGDNSVTSRLTPVSVLGGVKTFCQISAGNAHSLAIDKNGRAWGWGNNGNGQLGINQDTVERTPVQICNI